jgi:predicted small lipoprotein YifL
MKRLQLPLIVLGLLLILTGCGQKGPLTLPDGSKKPDLPQISP